MDSRTGKRVRLGRIFSQVSMHSVIVAFSHGVIEGPGRGRETTREMLETAFALRDAEAILVSPGMVPLLETAFIGRQRPSLMVHVDWTSFGRRVLPSSAGTSAALASIEDVVRVGADGIMTYLYFGQDDPLLERADVERNAMLARECDRLGVVLMIEPRSSREWTHPDEPHDATTLAMYCRVAAEIGADLVKCIWPGDVAAFEYVARSCPVPVLVAGGPNDDDALLTLNQAADAMAAGAAGVVFGRKVYEAADPGKMLAALRDVVHAGRTPVEAAREYAVASVSAVEFES